MRAVSRSACCCSHSPRQPSNLPASCSATTVRQSLGSGIAAFARIDNISNVVYISDRLEGIFTGMPRRFSLGVEYTY